MGRAGSGWTLRRAPQGLSHAGLLGPDRVLREGGPWELVSLKRGHSAGAPAARRDLWARMAVRGAEFRLELQESPSHPPGWA